MPIRMRLFASAAILLSILCLASCTGTNHSSISTKAPEPVIITYITTVGNGQSTAIIRELAEEYRREHPHVTFSYEEVGAADLPHRIQLLAASNDLPVMFSYPSGKPLKDLIESGAVLNIEETFKELGMNHVLLRTATELLRDYVDELGLYALPLEMNLEGFWYNKVIFAELGIQEPQTWEELMDAAQTLLDNGIQPFTLAGKEKWPITRYLNAYIIRKAGPDAMREVDQGTRRLTEEPFVAAAGEVRDMATRGYFGKQPGQVTYGQANRLFLQGQAGIFYSGSWSLRGFNNGKERQLGSKSIGFFEIPEIEGGEGSRDEYPVNAGLTTAFSLESYNEDIGQWIKFVFERYGQRAMGQHHMISGFAVDELPNNVPALTRMIQEKLSMNAKGTLWFEARMTTTEEQKAWENAQRLITDSDYSAEQYMSELQQEIDKRR